MVNTPDKEQELSLYNQWKTSQSTEAFQSLYNQMKPLLYDAARKASYGSNIPESAHRAWAAQNFYASLNTFKPESGASLQTHVYGAVHQKAKRLNYLYQNLGHISEPRAMQVGTYKRQLENLQNDLGRMPSSAELADSLGWGLKDVERIQKELHRDLSLDSGDGPEFGVHQTREDEEMLEYVYYELNPQQQVVYDYALGKHGRPKMNKPNGKIDFGRIAGTVGFSESKVRMLFNQIKDKASKAFKR